MHRLPFAIVSGRKLFVLPLHFFAFLFLGTLYLVEVDSNEMGEVKTLSLGASSTTTSFLRRASDSDDLPKQLNIAARVAECDPLPSLPSNLPVSCDQVRTIGLGATGSTFVSYVLGEIGNKIGWERRVLHDHSREVSNYDLCSLAMVRDFRDIVCSTLKRKNNCMRSSQEKITA